MKCGTK